VSQTCSVKGPFGGCKGGEIILGKVPGIEKEKRGRKGIKKEWVEVYGFLRSLEREIRV